jgi:hypothetical protein
MKATRILHELGQSLWLDNITRNLLNTGVLRRYIDELSVTGLTSNPTIFDHAIKNSSDYDESIRSKLRDGKTGEALFFELALEDHTPPPTSPANAASAQASRSRVSDGSMISSTKPSAAARSARRCSST